MTTRRFRGTWAPNLLGGALSLLAEIAIVVVFLVVAFVVSLVALALV